jgi:hypothetical protein
MKLTAVHSLALVSVLSLSVGCGLDEPGDEAVSEDELRRRGWGRGHACDGRDNHGHGHGHGHNGRGGTSGGMAGTTGRGGTTGMAGTTGAGGATGMAGTTGAGGATTGTGGGGGTGPQCPQPPSGMVSWWHADNNYDDAVGTNTGMSAGAVAFGPGVRNAGFSLSGAEGAFVEVPDAPSLRFTSAMTIDAWIRPMAADARIVDKIPAFSQSGYLMDLTGGQLRLLAGPDLLTSGVTVPMGEFTHVAAVFSTSALGLYINGVLVASRSASGVPMPVDAVPLRIGADSNANTRFTGTIDEARVFNRALSAAEVATLFAQGTAPPCP